MLVVFILKGRPSPTNLKLVANCAFLQAPSNLKNPLAGSGGILGPGRQRLRIIDKEKSFVQNDKFMKHVVKNK